MKEQPGDRQSDPDDEAKEADSVNQGKPADPFGPKAFQIGSHPDGEESHGEEKRGTVRNTRRRKPEIV
jgi:hypothetical protein